MIRRIVDRSAVAILAAAGPLPAMASPLIYTPTNPSFGGSPFNSAHLLATAEASNKYKDPESQRANDPAQQFVDQLQSRLLSTVSSQIADRIFGENATDTGHFVFGDQVIDFVRGVESVTLTVFSSASNTTTKITLPLLGG